MGVTGNLDCADGDCPAKGAFYDFGKDQVCPNFGDDGTVCAASVSLSCDILDPPKTTFLHGLPGLDFDKDRRVQQCCKLESEESSAGK